MTSNRKSQWPVFFGAAVLVAGAALSVTISAMSASNVREKNRRAFVRKAESFRDAVRRELHLEIEVLESIRSLHGLSEQISPEQFEEFLQKGMAYQRRILQGFGFVQRMNHRERLLREASGDSEYALKFKVLDVSSDGEILPAPRRPVYFPLTYQTPEKALGVPVGYDFGGRTACRRAIETFETSESTVTGGKALDVVEGSRGSSKAVGYYVFSPILYAQIPGTPLKAREPGYLVGFAVGIIRPDELVNRAAERLPDAQLEASLARGQSGKQYGMAHEFTDVIRMAGADWFFACRPGPGFEQQADSFQPLLILLLGLTVTAFIGGEFLLVARRTKKVERDVQERTLQLREAKQKLEAENAERRRLEREIIEVGNREKLRVGQDLHDSLGQKLTAAVLQGRALVKNIKSSETGNDTQVEDVVDLVKSALSQVRRLAKGLAPVELGNEGLRGALERLARDTREIHGVECEIVSDIDKLELEKSVALHLYHISQEAVTNALKHGKADCILLKIERHGHQLRLVVRDNGIGIEPRRGPEGLGMRIMRHRADMIGGRLEVRNVPGGGAEVLCVVGLEERNYEIP